MSITYLAGGAGGEAPRALGTPAVDGTSRMPDGSGARGTQPAADPIAVVPFHDGASRPESAGASGVLAIRVRFLTDDAPAAGAVVRVRPAGSEDAGTFRFAPVGDDGHVTFGDDGVGTQTVRFDLAGGDV